MPTARPFKLLCVFTVLLASCSLDRIPLVNRPDINQGNIVSQEMVNQLRPGMNRRQVTYLLGSPLLTDPLHDNRWDYIYSTEPNGGKREERRITLVFERDQLIQLEGDFRPGAMVEANATKDSTIYIPKIERDQTIWQKITGLFDAGDLDD
ncbi:outer membrane protein assembly factor BamE [Methylolobus aquaticus]|nr:outer membrane protein assembly factor BamE [Methylolobus aquaticus]